MKVVNQCRESFPRASPAFPTLNENAPRTQITTKWHTRTFCKCLYPFYHVEASRKNPLSAVCKVSN